MSFFPVVRIARCALVSRVCFAKHRAIRLTHTVTGSPSKANLTYCAAFEATYFPTWPAICNERVKPLHRVALQIRLTKTFKEVA